MHGNPFTRTAVSESSVDGEVSAAAPTTTPRPIPTPTRVPSPTPDSTQKLIPATAQDLGLAVTKVAAQDSIGNYVHLYGFGVSYADGINPNLDDEAVKQYVAYLIDHVELVQKLAHEPVVFDKTLRRGMVFVGHDLDVKLPAAPNGTPGVTAPVPSGVVSFVNVNSSIKETALATEICQSVYIVSGGLYDNQEALCNTLGLMHAAVVSGMFPKCYKEVLYTSDSGNPVTCVGELYGINEFPTRAFFT